MAQRVIPVAVDTKTLTAMTGLGRQRLDKLRKDPTSGFPKPSRIGRSVRYIVAEVMQWLIANREGSSIVLPEAEQKKAPAASIVKAVPIQKVQPARKTKPTLAEVNRANAKVLAATPRKGQRCVGNMIETADGVIAKHFQMIPRHCDDGESLMSTHLIVHHKTHLWGRKPVRVVEAVTELETNASQAIGDFSASEKASSSHIEISYHQPDSGRANEVIPETLKRDYESGLSLDVICKRYHIGKSKLSKLLRAAGAQIRKPGRARDKSTSTILVATQGAIK